LNQDDRAPFVVALQREREAAYAPGEYVEQESLMRADEIRALAVRAAVGSGVSVLDVCCGIAGPGRVLTRELGCTYLGVDARAGAIDIARARAAGLDCRFAVARVPPLPDGEFDVVLLLETMLAFRDKGALLGEIAGAVAAGGRFAFTLEAGAPLTEPERARMPDADTVWLTPIEEVQVLLEQAGLVVRWQEDQSASHRAMAEALADAFAADATAISARIGAPALDELVAAHRLWIEWLKAGRVRKIAVVAETQRA
jgi:SAM-dependent methyltransferase